MKINMKITREQKMQQLAEERGKALEHVKDGAIFALNNRSSKALDRIYSAFQDYEKAAEKAERYIRRNFRTESTPLFVLFSHKTITDVYWGLSLQVKGLWDNVPELK